MGQQILRTFGNEPIKLLGNILADVETDCRPGLKYLLSRDTPGLGLTPLHVRPNRRQLAGEVTALPEMLTQRQDSPEESGQISLQVPDRHPGGT